MASERYVPDRLMVSEWSHQTLGVAGKHGHRRGGGGGTLQACHTTSHRHTSEEHWLQNMDMYFKRQSTNSMEHPHTCTYTPRPAHPQHTHTHHEAGTVTVLTLLSCGPLST